MFLSVSFLLRERELEAITFMFSSLFSWIVMRLDSAGGKLIREYMPKESIKVEGYEGNSDRKDSRLRRMPLERGEVQVEDETGDEGEI